MLSMNDEVLGQLHTFFSAYKLRTYRKHDVIIHEEDVPTGVYFIKEGYVRLYSVSRHGEEMTRLVMAPNDLFPIRWAISNQPIDYYAEPMTEVEAWHAPREKFLEFISSNPALLLEVTSKMLRRMGSLYKRMEYLAFGNAYEKVASILVIYARRFEPTKQTNVVIPIPFTHKDLGSLVGLTRETVSLEMETLKRKGLIGSEGHLILIPDIKLLEKESLLSDE